MTDDRTSGEALSSCSLLTGYFPIMIHCFDDDTVLGRLAIKSKHRANKNSVVQVPMATVVDVYSCGP